MWDDYYFIRKNPEHEDQFNSEMVNNFDSK